MCTCRRFGRFRILLPLGRPHELSSRPPGRPSAGEVEGDGHGSGRSRRNGQPRVNERPSKRGEYSESQSCGETMPDIYLCITWCNYRFAGLVLQYRLHYYGTTLITCKVSDTQGKCYETHPATNWSLAFPEGRKRKTREPNKGNILQLCWLACLYEWILIPLCTGLTSFVFVLTIPGTWCTCMVCLKLKTLP